MLDVFTPVLGLLVLGALARRGRLVEAGFWPSAERLCYFVLMPALLVSSLASADLRGLPAAGMALAVVGSLLAAAFLLVALNARLRLPSPAFTSVFQGGVRFNSYVGLNLASLLYGTEGVAVGALVAGVMVVTANVLCVGVFALEDGARTRPLAVLGQLAANPFILACLAGGGLNLAGVPLPGGLAALLKGLGQAALVVGTMTVGAALSFRVAAMPAGPLLLACAAKFALAPLLALLACRLVGLDGLPATVVVLFQALPTAPSSYVLAKQLGGDHRLMASIITVQTVVGCLLLPLALPLLRG